MPMSSASARRDHRIGQQDRHRPAQADQPRQRDGDAGVRRHRDPRCARQEFCGFAGDDDIGGADEAKAAAARGKALHRGDHRRLQPQQARHRVLQIGRRLPDIVGQLLALRRKRADVAARAEIRALAAQQQHAQVRLAVADHDGVAQRAQQFGAHAVGGIGPVEPQPRDAVGDVEQNRTLVDHRKLSPALRTHR